MQAINRKYEKSSGRAAIPPEAKVLISREEAAQLLSISQRGLDYLIAPSKPSDFTQMEASRSALANAIDLSFLRLPEVKSFTGLSKSSLYALIRTNSFPAPVRLGPRTVAWVRSEVNDWATERILTSRSAARYLGRRRITQRAPGDAWASSKKSA